MRLKVEAQHCVNFQCGGENREFIGNVDQVTNHELLAFYGVGNEHSQKEFSGKLISNLIFFFVKYSYFKRNQLQKEKVEL